MEMDHEASFISFLMGGRENLRKEEKESAGMGSLIYSDVRRFAEGFVALPTLKNRTIRDICFLLVLCTPLFFTKTTKFKV